MLNYKQFAALSTEDQDKYIQSKWFKQNAYTDFEMWIQPKVTMFIAFVLCMLEWPIVTYFVKNGAVQLILTFPALILCSIEAVVLQNIFHSLVGLIMGLEPLTSHDEFWLYEFPIHPCNQPSYCLFKRPSKSPEEVFDKIIKGLILRGNGARSQVKFVKILGKYFFKPLNSEERAQWRKRCKIVTDVTTEKGLIEFALNHKKLEGKDFDLGSLYVFYFPNIGNNESGLLTQGHHSLNDGISQM
jgi:hypothetical protein